MQRTIQATARASMTGLALAGLPLAGLIPGGLAVGVVGAITARPALAACSTAGGVTTCSGSSGGGAVGFALVANSNTVVNLGTLSGTTTALSVTGNANVVLNSGVIAGGAQGVSTNGGANTIVNSGTISSAPTGNALVLTGPGFVVVNSGLVSAVGGAGDTPGGAVNVVAGSGTIINSGRMDGGLFAAGATVINSGVIGVSTPGSGIINNAEQLQQGPAGVLGLRVDAGGGRDSLTLTGPGALGGTLRLAVQPGLYANSTAYNNILFSISGFGGSQFAAVTSSSVFLAASAAYAPNGVSVTLTRIAFNNPAVADSFNAQAIGGALESVYPPGGGGIASTFFGTLFGAGASPYGTLSGEVATGAQTTGFAAGQMFFDSVLGQVRARSACGDGGNGGGLAPGAVRARLAEAGSPWPPRAACPTWSVWLDGFGQGGARDGDAAVGSARVGYTIGGATLGVDARLRPGLLIGAAIGVAGSNFSLDGRAQSGDGRVLQAGLYGSWSLGPFYVDATVAYGRPEFSTTRIVSVGAVTERATGQFDGHQVGGQIEAGWRFRLGGIELTPFVGASVQMLRQNSFAETTVNTATNAPGVLGLSDRAQTTLAPLPYVGAQAATTWRLNDYAALTPRLRLSWAHETNTDRARGMSFLSIPEASFTVHGARAARDAAMVRAGVDLTLFGLAEVYAQFDGALAAGGSAYAGKGGIRLAW